MSKKKKRTFIQRVPMPVRGGIHAQSVRPQASRKWWAKRWLAFMEDLKMGARLGRGRSYALSGQVISVDVRPGVCEALVQGGGREPYRCKLTFDVMPPRAKKEILAKLRARPLLVAQLLVRNLPESVDLLFRAAGYPLVPTVSNAFETSCSCPDYANPCKHIAAVLFLLTEAFEQDPIRLLTLRGITREDLVGGSEEGEQETRTKGLGTAEDGQGTEESDQQRRENPSTLQPFNPSTPFWGVPPEMAPDFGPAPTAMGKAPLIRRLGVIPFWRGEQRFFEAMEQCGDRSGAAGWRIWAGDPPVRETIPRPEGGGLGHGGRVRTAYLDEI